MDESRLTALESNSAFQERTIHDLSEVMCRQQKEIDRLKAQLKEVVQRVAHAENPDEDNNEPEIENPPHY